MTAIGRHRRLCVYRKGSTPGPALSRWMYRVRREAATVPVRPLTPKPQQTPSFRTARRKQDQMSAPNKNYDPKAVASLAPEQVARALDEALTAVAAASNLDELKAARIAHEGDRAP